MSSLSFRNYRTIAMFRKRRATYKSLLFRFCAMHVRFMKLVAFGSLVGIRIAQVSLSYCAMKSIHPERRAVLLPVQSGGLGRLR